MSGEGKRYFEVVKPVALDRFNPGPQIGLSLGSIGGRLAEQPAGHHLVWGWLLVAAGILRHGGVLHNQHSHMQEVKLWKSVDHAENDFRHWKSGAQRVAHEIRNPSMPFRWDFNVSRLEFQPTDDQEQYSR